MEWRSLVDALRTPKIIACRRARGDQRAQEGGSLRSSVRITISETPQGRGGFRLSDAPPNFGRGLDSNFVAFQESYPFFSGLRFPIHTGSGE